MDGQASMFDNSKDWLETGMKPNRVDVVSNLRCAALNIEVIDTDELTVSVKVSILEAALFLLAFCAKL